MSTRPAITSWVSATRGLLLGTSAPPQTRRVSAGRAGYGTERIVCREPTVPKLFLINVALYAALIMAAASIVVRHRRRSRGRPLVPVRRRRGTIAEPAGEDTAQNDIAAAPRLGSDSGAPGSGPDLPAEPKGTAESKAPEAPSLGPGPRGPEAEPDGPQGDARSATSDEPIVSYYEQADRPMSDYLETLGWPHEPKIYDPGAAEADSAPELEEAAAVAARSRARSAYRSATSAARRDHRRAGGADRLKAFSGVICLICGGAAGPRTLAWVRCRHYRSQGGRDGPESNPSPSKTTSTAARPMRPSGSPSMAPAMR